MKQLFRRPPDALPIEAYPPVVRVEIARLREAEAGMNLAAVRDEARYRCGDTKLVADAEADMAKASRAMRAVMMSELPEKRATMAKTLAKATARRRGKITPRCNGLAKALGG